MYLGGADENEPADAFSRRGLSKLERSLRIHPAEFMERIFDGLAHHVSPAGQVNDHVNPVEGRLPAPVRGQVAGYGHRSAAVRDPPNAFGGGFVKRQCPKRGPAGGQPGAERRSDKAVGASQKNFRGHNWFTGLLRIMA